MIHAYECLIRDLKWCKVYKKTHKGTHIYCGILYEAFIYCLLKLILPFLLWPLGTLNHIHRTFVWWGCSTLAVGPSSCSPAALGAGLPVCWRCCLSFPILLGLSGTNCLLLIGFNFPCSVEGSYQLPICFLLSRSWLMYLYFHFLRIYEFNIFPLLSF